MRKHFVAIAVLTLLPACTAMRLSSAEFSPAPGKDAAGMPADSEACDQKAKAERPSGFNDTLGLETQYNRIFDECMQAKGYQRH